MPPRLLINSAGNEQPAFFSPDGGWIAYVSDETGRPEVHIRKFVASGDGPSAPPAGKLIVSNGARGLPRWRRDGRELTYVALDGKVMSVELTPVGADLKAGRPRELFALPEAFV